MPVETSPPINWLAPILPDLSFDHGFLIEGRTHPYYSFTNPDQNAHWSNQMTEFISEASKDHFIDRYNRSIALEGIRSAMQAKGAFYIDIGCSSGYMLHEAVIEFPAARIIGSDYFASGLLQCHQALPTIPLFQMDITDCKVSDNLFDAVTCLNVLEHIQQDDLALKELYRILKPGGRLAITVPMSPSLYDLMDDIHYHVRRYQYHELRKKILAAGFGIMTMNYFGVGIYPAFYLQKRFNQFRYGKLSIDEKFKKAQALTQQTGRMRWMEKLCRFEWRMGRHVSYPFGIRSYVIATK
jgi:ubiquinone/menaquinone biosynthesis C-methylase UbiE